MGSVVLQLTLYIFAREIKHYNAMLTKLSPISSFQAFGFPLVVCHLNGKPELFFGSDRFELLAHCIGESCIHSKQM